MKNIAVLISGSGTNLQSIIDNTKNSNINGIIRLVISNKETAYGLERAKLAGIKGITLKNNEEILEILKKEDIDLIVLAGYLKILPEELVVEYKNRIINIHPSLIPAFCGKGYYGEKVHKAVISSGVKFTGATTHFVDEGVDSGPILMQEIVKVEKNDDYITIAEKVLEKEHEILVKTVKAFCNDEIDIVDNKAYLRGEK